MRAIVDDESLAGLTRPMSEPFTDVIQDLWQLGHVTASYVAPGAGAILPATGIMEDNPVAIVVAALFLPFLAQLLAVSFGLWNRDRRLIVQGLRALLVSTVLAVAAGAVVAWIEGGPISLCESTQADLESDFAYLPNPFLPGVFLKTIWEVLDAPR